MIKDILKKASEMDASDVHLNTYNPPAFRIDGEIQRIGDEPLTAESIMECINTVTNDLEKEMYKKGEDIDSSYEDEDGNRFRINIFTQRKSPAMVVRLLNTHIPTLEEYNLPRVLAELAELPRGMVLVTGPTGSGKSTTLAAMINHINMNKKKHILTLEDPIEYIHEQKQSILNQREIHKDSKSFDDSLKSALREDPDIILIGEMRDIETIKLAITAAETGHLVLSTLHTIGAPDTINRIIDTFPADQQSQVRAQLSMSLKGVVSQVLIPKVGGGRIAAHEILISNDAIANNIRQNAIQNISSSMLSGKGQGMQLLDHKLAELVREGKIERDKAKEFVKDKEQFDRLMR